MARRTRGAKALAFLDFFETHAEILCEHFDCETLGRFALASHRTYAMNEAGPLRARWLAAADALASRRVRRVAVVDWDVHHGNGTQHILA